MDSSTKITNFASKNGFNIEGFSEKTAALLFDTFKTEKFSDLFKITEEDLLKLDGFKDLKTKKIIQAINKSKKVDFSNFIYALGIENIGKKTASDLADKYKNLDFSLGYETALKDEWSGDIGVGCKYFSQDAVIKLAPRAGIELDENLSLNENAQKYYSLYKKAKATFEYSVERYNQAKEKLKDIVIDTCKGLKI